DDGLEIMTRDGTSRPGDWRLAHALNITGTPRYRRAPPPLLARARAPGRRAAGTPRGTRPHHSPDVPPRAGRSGGTPRRHRARAAPARADPPSPRPGSSPRPPRDRAGRPVPCTAGPGPPPAYT